MAIDFDLSKVRGCKGFELKEVMSEEKARQVIRIIASKVFALTILKDDSRGQFEFSIPNCLTHAPIGGLCEYERTRVKIRDLSALVDYEHLYLLHEGKEVEKYAMWFLRDWSRRCDQIDNREI